MTVRIRDGAGASVGDGGESGGNGSAICNGSGCGGVIVWCSSSDDGRGCSREVVILIVVIARTVVVVEW